MVKRKVCAECGSTKKLSIKNIWIKKDGSTSHNYRCSECNKRYCALYYKKNRAKHIRNVIEYKKNRNKINQWAKSGSIK